MPKDDDNQNLPALPAKPPLPTLFESLGFGKVATSDKIKLSYQNGVVKASVTKHDGFSQTVTRTVGAGFRSETEFDPAQMKSKEDRNEEICRRYKKGSTQADLGGEFGLSQAMINRIVNNK